MSLETQLDLMTRSMKEPILHKDCPVPGGKLYQMGLFAIIISTDDGILHMSISHPSRYPTWEEIKKARYKLLPPDKYFVQVLPPMEKYVNIHPNCFHLWELTPKTLHVLEAGA